MQISDHRQWCGFQYLQSACPQRLAELFHTFIIQTVPQLFLVVCTSFKTNNFGRLFLPWLIFQYVRCTKYWPWQRGTKIRFLVFFFFSHQIYFTVMELFERIFSVTLLAHWRLLFQMSVTALIFAEVVLGRRQSDLRGEFLEEKYEKTFSNVWKQRKTGKEIITIFLLHLTLKNFILFLGYVS